MKIFKDKEGRDWCMNLTYTGIEEINAQVGVDLLDLEKVTNLHPIKILRAIAAACNDQIKERGLTVQQFVNCFDGDTIEAASESLLDEVQRFFQKRHREMFQKITVATKNVLEKKLAKADAIIQSPDLEDQIEKALEKLLTSKSGGLPASLASTPALSPTDNLE